MLPTHVWLACMSYSNYDCQPVLPILYRLIDEQLQFKHAIQIIIGDAGPCGDMSYIKIMWIYHVIFCMIPIYYTLPAAYVHN